MLRMTNKKNSKKSRIGNALMIIGVILILLCINYILFTMWCTQAGKKLETQVNGYKCTATGILAVAEGTVEITAKGVTLIAYYYEWDGAIYYKVIPYTNPDYPENAKVIVVYILGVGPGDCLVSGFYLDKYLRIGVAGLIMIVFGIIGKEWRRRKWQEERLLPETGR